MSQLAGTKPPQAGIVARVSQGDTRPGDDEDERSIEEQRAECETACHDNGWAIAAYYEMVQSASRFAKRERQRWLDLQADIDAGRIQVVVMWEPSRGSRTLTDWSGFLDRARKHHVLIHVVVDERTYDVRVNSDWKNLADLGVDSAHESDKISDRTWRGMRANATNGRPHSLTYGYKHTYIWRKGRMRVDSQEPKEPEASVVREITHRVSEGHAVSRIVADLNARGITPPSGDRSKTGRWYPAEVRRIAMNPMYISERHWLNRKTGVTEILPGNWPALVSRADHLAAVRILTDRSAVRARPGRYIWLLSDVATCAECGAPLRVFRATEYACRDHGSHGHGHGRVPVADLELWAEGLVLGRLCQPDVIGTFLNADDAAAERAREEEAKLRAQLDQAARDAAHGLISNRALGIMEAELEPMIAAAVRRANELALPGALRPFAGVIGKMAAVHKLWLQTPMAAKRDIIKALAEPVTLAFADPGAPLEKRFVMTWREAPSVPAGSAAEPVPTTYTPPSWAPSVVLTD